MPIVLEVLEVQPMRRMQPIFNQHHILEPIGSTTLGMELDGILLPIMVQQFV
jgi:hypothetical protein